MTVSMMELSILVKRMEKAYKKIMAFLDFFKVNQ
jgi:hypothetical protein